MTLTETIIDRFGGPLGRLLGAIRRAEEFLGPDDDWVEDDRRVLFEAVNVAASKLGRPTIKEKGPRDYITTTDTSPDEIEEALHPKYQRNLLSTRKYRSTSGGRQWAAGSWVYDPEDTSYQHHVFIFPARSGGTDIYGHREKSVRDPDGHLNDEQTPGDPNGLVAVQLAMSGIATYDREL